MSAIQTASLLVLALYLLAFFAGSALAARSAGRSIWLFGKARGLDRLAAIGFRASFGLALVAPPLYLIAPDVANIDPLWWPGLGAAAVPGHLIAVGGTMLAFAAQMAMGASWRVGVLAEATGALVSDGLYTFSRNPTFLGQAMLLAGVALALPSLPGLLAVLLFVGSAQIQIRSEEAALLAHHGDAFNAFRTRTPRWVGRARKGAGTGKTAG
ncbi:hypothetical protein XMM379_001461 [Aliiroseovarius sp. xm-m-379]|uniref:methyltransferase family protein n=1 Tax=unclassified Aliiroseovarius TaxID=2623558 RepID=UPI001569548F|nr:MULTISPECIES: isoprenylcysteine carboxylmethyltransferase family protein [unclassified Aliiroseovarius]NRP12398.1 hypothetical protein [Aliiroseovarius sp. xm-d-517]NRP24772.1 hypothetical protein [Aliiroseovarius sp. xm-m-379]NRP30593.1 hypothetical protein [Aliiroseovarius sp. xm-m-314]NRP33571.1 hypothetical protein [Aliiroseovarius sp. xm-a-104]NRP40678.1 hypothetical protein [Aliiroseovarius sp. xm-m-339-2]